MPALTSRGGVTAANSKGKSSRGTGAPTRSCNASSSWATSCVKRATSTWVAGLQNYDWPGNIRELRNVIQRAVILARGGLLQFDLPVTDTAPGIPPSESALENQTGLEFFTEAEMLCRERENLKAVLVRAGGKIKGPAGAAELLGVKPTTLLSRMKKMGLKRAS